MQVGGFTIGIGWLLALLVLIVVLVFFIVGIDEHLSKEWIGALIAALALARLLP